MQSVMKKAERVILFSILVAVFFVQSSSGQGLVLKLAGGGLEITNVEDLQLSYLAADQFQKLDWEPGYAYYPDGSSRKFDGMKYDPATDLIQVSTGGYVLTLLPGVIDGVSMEIDNTVTRIFVKVPLKKPVFMEVLSPGKLNLLIYRGLKGEQAKIQSNTVVIRLEKEVKIIEFEEQLYVWGVGGVDKLKSSKKAILALMEDNAAAVEEFMDKSGIKTKEIANLKRIFDYYNQLE